MSPVDPALPPDEVPARRRLGVPIDPRQWRFGEEPEARLPALLAGVLLFALLLQLLLVEDAELPPPRAVPAALPQVSQPDLAIPGIAAAIAARPLFTPRLVGSTDAAGAAGAAVTSAPPPPLGGATVAGTVTVRGARYAVVLVPGRGVVRMRPGARLAGWTLRRLDDAGATFTRGGRRLIVPYGGGNPGGGAYAGQGDENE